MEEWIGERWHRLITRAADRSFAAQAVTLEAMQRPVGLLFRAAGGAPAVRVVPAAQARIGGPRDWLQRLAGAATRAAVTRLDGDTLALPPLIAVFDDAALNRDLYLWLAALAAVHQPGQAWVAGQRYRHDGRLATLSGSTTALAAPAAGASRAASGPGQSARAGSRCRSRRAGRAERWRRERP